MADTITILDGLSHAQNTAQTATLFDIDDAVDSVVRTFTVPVPFSASQARVIFNNQFDPDGSAVMVRVHVTQGDDIDPLSKTENPQSLSYTVVAQGAVTESGSIDLSLSYHPTLHIDCCIISTTAHTGTEIIVQIASEASVDDAWTDIGRMIGPIGTGISAVLPSDEAAGQTEISITNPVANNFDNDGKFKFIKNDGAANSEIVFQVSHTEDEP